MNLPGSIFTVALTQANEELVLVIGTAVGAPS